MKVAKWGNSLAVRLPASLVETQGIEEGDDIQLNARGSYKPAKIAKAGTAAD